MQKPTIGTEELADILRRLQAGGVLPAEGNPVGWAVTLADGNAMLAVRPETKTGQIHHALDLLEKAGVRFCRVDRQGLMTGQKHLSTHSPGGLAEDLMSHGIGRVSWFNIDDSLRWNVSDDMPRSPFAGAPETSARPQEKPQSPFEGWSMGGEALKTALWDAMFGSAPIFPKDQAQIEADLAAVLAEYGYEKASIVTKTLPGLFGSLPMQVTTILLERKRGQEGTTDNSGASNEEQQS